MIKDGAIGKLTLIMYSKEEAVKMGLLNTGQTHKPEANSDFSKKDFIGDAIAKINTIKKYVKEGEVEERVMVEFEVTRAIPDAKGRETTIVYGDKIAKFYRENGGKKSSFSAFFNDMFTAGIDINTSNEESLELSLTDAVNKLVYLRCWVSEFKGDDGEDVKYQNVNVRNKDNITPEMEIPEIPI